MGYAVVSKIPNAILFFAIFAGWVEMGITENR